VSETLKQVTSKFDTFENSDIHNLKDNVFKLLTGWKTIIENLGTRVNHLEVNKTSATVQAVTNPFTTLGINHNQPSPSTTPPSTNIQSSNYSDELLNSINNRLEKVEKHNLHQGKDGLLERSR
jgi:hypothetical protein